MEKVAEDDAPSDESSILTGNTNLFIGDLSKEATEKDLEDLFATIAPVKEVSIKRSKASKKPLGYGFVKMETAAGAAMCLDTLQCATLCGRQIRIGWGEVDCCFKVDNLDTSITADEIHDLFSGFGSLESSRTELFKNESGASTILHFSSRDCAETAKSTMHGKRFNGRLLRVEWSNPSKKSSDINSRGGTPTFKKPIGIQEGVIDDLSLTERTLSYNSIHVQFESEPGAPVSNAHLLQIFSSFGKVTDVSIKNIVSDKDTNVCRGYGFVHFDWSASGRDAAIRAAKEVVNVTINGLLLFAELSNVFKKSEADRKERLRNAVLNSHLSPVASLNSARPRGVYRPQDSYTTSSYYGQFHTASVYNSGQHQMQGGYIGYTNDPYMSHGYGGHVSPLSPYATMGQLPMGMSPFGAFSTSPVFQPSSPVYVYSPHTGVAHAVFNLMTPGHQSFRHENQFKREPNRARSTRNSLRGLREADTPAPVPAIARTGDAFPPKTDD